jgi:hypothetical protein
MAFDLSNYVDVPARLRMALEKYPNMSVLEHPVQVREVDGKTYIEVTVEVICNDDADRRATASAWEIHPGQTPYTKESEMMNSSTSALGRALGFLGFGIAKSIASQDEVRARQEFKEKIKTKQDEDLKQAFKAVDSHGSATPKQIGFLKSLARGKGWDDLQLLDYIHRLLQVDDVVVETLTSGQCHAVIDGLKK